MKLDIQCDPNEESYVLKHEKLVTQKLITSLMLILQGLHADDLRRGTFIGKGIDSAAVVETATKAERAAAEHAAAFNLPAEEVERNRQFAADARVARKALRW